MDKYEEVEACENAKRDVSPTANDPNESAVESTANAVSRGGDDEESDAFFSKTFASNLRSSDAESFDAAFAGGLRSIFDAEEETDDGDEEDERREPDLELSDAERIQRDLELERREALDAAILQNDADFLFEAGAKYESPRASENDFKANEPGTNKRSENVDDEPPPFRRALVRPESILESMLFVGDRDNNPLPISRACELIRNLSEKEAREILAKLNARYERDGTPYRIVEEPGGFRLALKNGYDDVIANFLGKPKEFKLSQTAIDVLALIAYRQPISIDEILTTRPSGRNALSQLAKRDLVASEIRIVDNKKVSYFRTTERFLKLFNLESLNDLPIIGDVDYR